MSKHSKKFETAAAGFEAAKRRAVAEDQNSGMAVEQVLNREGQVTQVLLTSEAPGPDGRSHMSQSKLMDYEHGILATAVVVSQREGLPDGSVRTLSDVKTHTIDKTGKETRDEYQSESRAINTPEGLTTITKEVHRDGTRVDSESLTRQDGEYSHTQTQSRTVLPNGEVLNNSSETHAKTSRDSHGHVTVQSESVQESSKGERDREEPAQKEGSRSAPMAEMELGD